MQHLVGGADHLGVHFVGALRRDQVGNFGDHLDIGLFEVALLHVAEAVGVGDAVLRRARGRRVREQVVADRLQARLVDEARQPDLADVASASVDPGSVTETWPWALMVMPEEFCGMVIVGCTGLPWALTMRPCVSIWNEPSRV